MLKKQFADKVKEARAALTDALREQNKWEIYADAIDCAPVPHGVEKTSGFYFINSGCAISFHVFYIIKSFSDFMPLLEHFENTLISEFSSYDNNGVRNFIIENDDLGITLTLRATPADDGTCQKILVGQNTKTTTEPRYELRCN